MFSIKIVMAQCKDNYQLVLKEVILGYCQATALLTAQVTT